MFEIDARQNLEAIQPSVKVEGRSYTIREDLYVRKCYIDLWNSLNSLSLPLQRAHLCAGTSGIGKQYLSLYPYEVKEELEVFQDTFSPSRDQQEAIAKTKERQGLVN
ncbi:hypothetical protein PPL_06420 [Heterostelium album PN500]|uniref:Uncharacterized protein n=1 Tax=Heterostelium pallidum (strain ATCC 26659 / Pp 5 / PN500) TaxID=670386 RepID=D3BD40_HETP5|nr:hypothetical protein PPL_06420 [Heterostelium album PN500]EFA80832.1 hypothetical protein PPL_06420 [Heterostelium album PN500]|eukprot:XP_020432951.1 hypothetical protein PPL_06420 [Heterostelium album PN500]